jgi:hypothetical protein
MIHIHETSQSALTTFHCRIQLPLLGGSSEVCLFAFMHVLIDQRFFK